MKQAFLLAVLLPYLFQPYVATIYLNDHLVGVALVHELGGVREVDVYTTLVNPHALESIVKLAMKYLEKCTSGRCEFKIEDGKILVEHGDGVAVVEMYTVGRGERVSLQVVFYTFSVDMPVLVLAVVCMAILVAAGIAWVRREEYSVL